MNEELRSKISKYMAMEPLKLTALACKLLGWTFEVGAWFKGGTDEYRAPRTWNPAEWLAEAYTLRHEALKLAGEGAPYMQSAIDSFLPYVQRDSTSICWATAKERCVAIVLVLEAWHEAARDVARETGTFLAHYGMTEEQFKKSKLSDLACSEEEAQQMLGQFEAGHPGIFDKMARGKL
jgi:hypothetical protein